MEAPKHEPLFEYLLRPSGYEAVFQKPLPTELCWYDCHPLPTDVAPVSMPMNCPPNHKVPWRLFGKFCSWSCCRSYNFEFMHDSRCSDRDTWIAVLAYQIKHKVGMDEESKVRGGHYHRSTVAVDGRGSMRMRTDLTFAMPRLRLIAFGGDLTIEKFRAPVVASDHLIPILVVENARIHQTSDLEDIYAQHRTEQLREQRERALRIEPESCRLAMHVRSNEPLPKPLPAVDVVRERAKLPMISARHAMLPFDPSTERSDMEEKLNAPKRQRGFFAATQLSIPLTTAPVPRLEDGTPAEASKTPPVVSAKAMMKRARRS